MKKLKKTFLSIVLAVTSIASSMNVLSVSAYTPKKDWAVYYVYGAPSNTPGLYPICHRDIYTYSGGYKTNCTFWDAGNEDNAYVAVSTSYFNYNHYSTGISGVHYHSGGSTISFTFSGNAYYGQCKASGTVGYA